MSRQAEDEFEGRRVGRYVIYGELAAGGTASVHLGRLVGPAGFSRTVAIKRLHQHLASEAEFVTMLIDEAHLASSINHPNVVSSLDVVSEGDEILLVMDYVEGETLATLLRSSRKDRSLRAPRISVMVRVLTDVLAGLHAAHTAKTPRGRPLHIVHRDVSPQNIMVGFDGIARVLDFGVATAAHRRHSTRPGRIKGKLAYMSPEQVRGEPVDARTDVFAAGVVLWECLTQRRLFRSEGEEQAKPRVLTQVTEAPSAHNPQISRALDQVVLRALSYDREARFASAAEFADALAAATEQSSSVEVGRWVTATAKRPSAERQRLFDDVDDVDDVDESTVDAGVQLGARPQERAPARGRAGETSESSRQPSLVSTVVVPLLRSRTPGWPRVIRAAIGASLLLFAGAGVFSQSTPTPESAPATTAATVLADQITIGKGDRSPTGMLWRGQRRLDADRRGRETSQADSERQDIRHEVPNSRGNYRIRSSSTTAPVSAKAAPVLPAAPHDARPSIVAADGPRLPPPAASQGGERSDSTHGSTRASPTIPVSRATKARSPRARASKPAPERRIPKSVAAASPPVAKPQLVAAQDVTEARAESSCDVPYRVDARGIRRVRRECL
jgi:serine/threonine protein kinase